jgi:hypothetical protein
MLAWFLSLILYKLHLSASLKQRITQVIDHTALTPKAKTQLILDQIAAQYHSIQSCDSKVVIKDEKSRTLLQQERMKALESKYGTDAAKTLLQAAHRLEEAGDSDDTAAYVEAMHAIQNALVQIEEEIRAKQITALALIVIGSAMAITYALPVIVTAAFVMILLANVSMFAVKVVEWRQNQAKTRLQELDEKGHELQDFSLPLSAFRCDLNRYLRDLYLQQNLRYRHEEEKKDLLIAAFLDRTELEQLYLKLRSRMYADYQEKLLQIKSSATSKNESASELLKKSEQLSKYDYESFSRDYAKRVLAYR